MAELRRLAVRLFHLIFGCGEDTSGIYVGDTYEPTVCGYCNPPKGN